MQTAYDRAMEVMNALYDGDRDVVFPSKNRWKLAQRFIRAQDRKPGQVLPIYVAVQSTARYYGGPEEGGWWYNNTWTEEVFKFWSARDALAKLRELRDEYGDPRYGIYSAANRGEPEYSFVITHDPSFWESREYTERPHYE
jgi:hypothetical protein